MYKLSAGINTGQLYAENPSVSDFIKIEKDCFKQQQKPRSTFSKLLGKILGRFLILGRDAPDLGYADAAGSRDPGQIHKFDMFRFLIALLTYVNIELC